MGLTQSNVIWIIHCNVGQKFFHLFKCLLLSLVFFHFYISQGSDAFTVWWDIYNNQTIASCIVYQLKNFENRSIISEDMDKIEVARFYWPKV